MPASMHARRARRARWAASGATLSALGAGIGVVAATRAWHRAADATGGDPLGVPDGHRLTVETDDGAQLHVKVLEPSARPATAAIDPETRRRTVVLSHCWTGDHRVWGPVAQRLVDAGHPVVLYDQRGHGASVVGADGCTLEALGADLRAVLEHLDLREVVTAGHSMGGMSAQSYAIHHADSFRDRVAGLVLVATASSAPIGGRNATAGFLRRIVATDLAGRTLASGRVGPLVVRNTVGTRPSMAHLGAVCETFVATQPHARGDFFRAMEALEFGEQLAKVDVPTIVACGTHDRLTPLHHSRAMVAALPDARLEVFHGDGHMLPFEAPDRVADLIVELAAV